MEPSDPTKQRKVIASVQRALDILDLFDSKHAELGNAEIARMMDLPVGTVAGLIYTLKVRGYLAKTPVNRKYRLGFKLAERTRVLFDQLDLRRVALPYLEQLREWCGESVNLAIQEGLLGCLYRALVWQSFPGYPLGTGQTRPDATAPRWEKPSWLFGPRKKSNASLRYASLSQ